MGESVSISDRNNRSSGARVVDGRLLVDSGFPGGGNPNPSIPTADPIFRYLDLNGDGTGSSNVNGDYSAAEEEFFIQPASGTLVIESMIVTVFDAGSFQTGRYGALPSGLTNGIDVQVRSGVSTVENDLTDGIRIKSSSDWSRVCHDVNLVSLGGGDSSLSVLWTFGRSGQALRIKSGQRLAVVLNDDFTGITEQCFNVQGFLL